MLKGGDEMSFKVGDTVKLKSDGGVWMTVVDLNWHNQTGRIRCQWFSSKEDKFKFGVFREEALEIQGSGPRAIVR